MIVAGRSLRSTPLRVHYHTSFDVPQDQYVYVGVGTIRSESTMVQQRQVISWFRWTYQVNPLLYFQVCLYLTTFELLINIPWAL